MIRAYVHEDIIGFNLSVSVVMHPAQGAFDIKPRVLHFDGDGHQSRDEIENGAIERPAFTLGHEEAAAVLNALTAQFHGADDTRALRNDYDAERKRTDGLTGTLSSLALKLAEPA